MDISISKQSHRSRFAKFAVGVFAVAAVVAGALSLRDRAPTARGPDRRASDREFEGIRERLRSAPESKAAEIMLTEIRFHITDNVRRELKGELSDLRNPSDSMCFPETQAMSAARFDAIMRVMATLPSEAKAQVVKSLKQEKEEIEKQQDWLGRPNTLPKNLPPRLVREQQFLPPQKWKNFRREQLMEIERLRLRRFDLHDFIDVLEEQLNEQRN